MLKPGGRLIVQETRGIKAWDSSELRSTIGFTVDERMYRRLDVYADGEKLLKLSERIGFLVDVVLEFERHFVAILSRPA